jgi:hypothetical protein
MPCSDGTSLGGHAQRRRVERQRVAKPVQRDEVVGEDTIGLGPTRIAGQRARAERLVTLRIVQQPGRGRPVAQHETIVRVDLEHLVEAIRRRAIAAVVEHVRSAFSSSAGTQRGLRVRARSRNSSVLPASSA